MAQATSVFYLPGMDCPVEEKLVRTALAKVPGVNDLDFNLIQRKLKVRHNPDALPQINQALLPLDMGAALLQEGKEPEVQPESAKQNWLKLGIALAFALLSEILDIAGGHEAGLGLLKFLSLTSAVTAITLCGLGTWRKGIIAIKHLNLNINALMAVAVTGAVLIGQWPEAAMVMALFNISEALEAGAMDRARNAIKGLLELAPLTAEVLNADGYWQAVPAADVPLGSRIRVKPGEKIPLDGTIIAGTSAVNQAPITGESMPITKSRGDFVYAGTLNGNGTLEFESTAWANDTTLARIIHAVENAQTKRAPMQRILDTFAAWYTPVIFLLALLFTLVPPLAVGADWFGSLYTGLVILVIGCPCALVISTPITIVSGLARATKMGILIKGGIFLEQGRLLRCMALDKTGTITLGEPQVTKVETFGELSLAEVLSIGFSLASQSDHPVSLAISNYGRSNFALLKAADNFEAVPGHGVKGIIGGRDCALGNSGLVPQPLPENVARQIESLEMAGQTVSLLFCDGKVAALFAVADKVRSNAVAAIDELKSLGITPVMLTGDNTLAAESIGRQVGVEVIRANLLPGEKQRAIESLQAEYGLTGMVGDGINDAPALAQANISFAMAKAGTDTAIETADVALMDDDIGKLPRFIQLSRAAFVIFMENIVFALGIKGIVFALALMHLATMWMAVFADVGAALIVIANSMRILRK